MMKALVEPSGRIAQIVPDGKEFPVATPLRWIDAPGGATTNWRHDGQRFMPPERNTPDEPPMPSRLERLITALKSKGVITDADL